MIIWLASYPRSGNTFLRMVVDELYGRGSSTVYPVDGVLERLGSDVLTAAVPGASLADLRTSTDVHFVKTHRRRSFDVDDSDSALYLVRDGRDALVSFARQRTEEAPERYRDELRALIDRRTGGTASWGQNVLSWLPAAAPADVARVVVLRFEHLTREPVGSVTDAVAQIAPHLRVQDDVSLPTFADLQRLDQRFFRRGRVGTHREEMPAELEQRFWSYQDNRDAMERLGYQRSPES